MNMWNPKAQNFIEEEDDDESWEAKAFEQDTKGNISGSTWPPRSYTCNFCLREFRSAQALGGHMNVHRRDRAASKALVRGGGGGGGGGTTLLSTCVAPLIIQSKGSTNIEGLSHFYKLQNPSGGFFCNSSDMMNLYGTTSSFCSSNVAFSMLDSPGEVVPPPRLIEYSTRDDDDDDDDDDGRIGLVKEKTCAISVDEPDLELRLGHNPP